MESVLGLLVDIDNCDLLDSILLHLLQCATAYLVADAVEQCIFVVYGLGQDFSFQVNISFVFGMYGDFLCSIEVLDYLLACLNTESPEENSSQDPLLPVYLCKDKSFFLVNLELKPGSSVWNDS